MKRALLSPLCALLFSSLAACGGARDGAAKELEALRTEIVKLRNETAMLADRVGALERPSPKRASHAAAGGAPGKEAASDRPPLEVVRLEPSASRGSSPGARQEELALLGDAALDEGDDGEARPVLRSGPGGAVIEDKAPKARASVAGSKVPKALGASRPVKGEVPR
jgi:hypothetical protein